MTAFLYNINNNELIFDNILEFNFFSNIISPANQLSITLISKTTYLPNFYKIKLCHNNHLIFDGFIDQQTILKSSDGILIKIKARSSAALLLDNQAQPQTYNNISLNDILNNHIAPYGFSFKEIDPFFLSTSLNNFSVFPNMSEWAVLESFLKQSLNLFPFIYSNNFIRISNSFPSSNLTISNHINCYDENSPQNFNYSHISINFNNFGLVSDVIVKNPDNSFSHITNPFALNRQIKSKRYSSFSKDLINTRLSEQNKKSFSISLSVPKLLPASIGHKIPIIDECIPKHFSNKEFIIDKLYYKFKNGELISYLSLIISDMTQI